MSTEFDKDRAVWQIRKAQKEGRWLDGPPGMAAQWDKKDGARLVPWQQSLIDKGRLRDPGLPQEHAFAVPKVVKRTASARLESMIQRLAAAPKWQQERLLQDIAAGYWKEGSPVTMDALRKAAGEIMNRADNRIKLSNKTGG